MWVVRHKYNLMWKLQKKRKHCGPFLTIMHSKHSLLHYIMRYELTQRWNQVFGEVQWNSIFPLYLSQDIMFEGYDELDFPNNPSNKIMIPEIHTAYTCI